MGNGTARWTSHLEISLSPWQSVLHAARRPDFASTVQNGRLQALIAIELVFIGPTRSEMLDG
jgi:hypothetical protein